MGEPVILREKIAVPSVRSVPRERIDGLLDRPEYRLTMLLGPAGSGKSTALVPAVRRCPHPCAYLHTDEADGDAGRFLRYLVAAFEAALDTRLETGDGADVHESVDALVAALERIGPVSLAIDDLHTVYSTPAEAVLARIVRYLPRPGRVLVATRREPSFDLSRLRLAGDLRVLDADTLRFRHWEVEQLYRDHYGSPLPPRELAELARRTGGWAAALQLFHLATDGLTLDSRRSVLDALATRTRAVRDYLTRNVLDQIDPELRQFLLDTCVLVDVDAGLCDDLRDATGSGDHLRELDRRQLLLAARGTPGTYRYHEVLRHHLQAVLLDEIGEAGVRRRFARAGELLEVRGRMTDALVAHARGGDDGTVRRLLGRSAEQLADEPGDWVASLPSSVVSEDPWVALTVARHAVRIGRLRDALGAYDHAGSVFGPGPGAELCRHERATVRRYVEAGHPPGGAGWDARLQRLLGRKVRRSAGLAATPSERLVAVADHVVRTGDLTGVDEAVRTLDPSAGVPHPPSDPHAQAAGRLLQCFGRHLVPGSARAPAATTAVVADVEARCGPWLGRIGTALLAVTAEPAAIGAAESITATDDGQEPWTSVLAAHAAGCGRLHTDPAGATDLFDRAQRAATEVDAPVLAVWASLGAAVGAAASGSVDARGRAERAVGAAVSCGVPAVERIASALVACLDGDGAAWGAVCDEFAIEVDVALADGPGGGVHLGTFGTLTVDVGGDRHVVGEELKPRWRSVFAVLVASADEVVHQDSVLAAIWPDVDPSRGKRSLQVAVSGIRGWLDQLGVRDLLDVERAGGGYRLRLDPEVRCDHVDLENDLASGRKARSIGDVGRAVVALGAATAHGAGAFLEDEGTAEWVLEPRDHWRRQAADAAQELAALHLEAENWSAAAAVAADGLAVDRHRDVLWRHRLAALDAAGDVAAAARARRDYRAVLVELGVDPDDLAPA